MQRNKTVDYDEDDVYDEDDYYDDPEQDQSYEYTEEDKHNFATLTPVVRAEIEEAGLQASDREIEDALWNYYWDVGKSVGQLKSTKQAKGKGGKGAGEKEVKKEKVASRFDQAAERSKGGDVGKGESGCFLDSYREDAEQIDSKECDYSGPTALESRRGGLYITSPINLEHRLTPNR